MVSSDKQTGMIIR